MAPQARSTAPVLLAVVALAAACHVALGQMPMGGDPFADWTPEGVGVVKSDLPYIRCGVCQRVSQKLLEALRHKKRLATKSKPVGELQIIELTEKICDRKTAEGEWILHTDMEEDGDKIKVSWWEGLICCPPLCPFPRHLCALPRPRICVALHVLLPVQMLTASCCLWLAAVVVLQLTEYDFAGECASECRTIQRACEDVSSPPSSHPLQEAAAVLHVLSGSATLAGKALLQGLTEIVMITSSITATMMIRK